MNTFVLEHWSETVIESTVFVVFPDGCRDLVLRQEPGHAPQWHASSLMIRPQRVESHAGEHFEGYRLQPGCLIDEGLLHRCLVDKATETADAESLLSECVSCHPDVPELLASLSSGLPSVSVAASCQGVSMRTFQRHVMRATQQTATFWLTLMRARSAARLLTGEAPLAEIAHESGYADQSHMTRDFRRWFDTTPSALRFNPMQLQSLLSPGCC